jgi:hypothetical protein
LSTEFEQRAYVLATCPAVRELPRDERWALQDALLEAEEYDDLPEHIQILFRDDLFEPILEARYLERLHPRGRAGRWVRSFRHLELPHVAPSLPPGELLQGKKPRGGRGRKAPLKGRAKGWRERIGELRHEPVLHTEALQEQRREAMKVHADKPPEPRPPEPDRWQARKLTRADINRRQMTQFEVRDFESKSDEELPFAVLDRTNGVTVRYYPTQREADEGAEKLNEGDRASAAHFEAQAAEKRAAYAEAKEFLDAWWGEPGRRRGRYQTISGDPGEAFEEQHARLMEAGAHIDAEVSRRIRPLLQEHLAAKKKWRAKQREVKRLRKEEEDMEFEALRKSVEYHPEFGGMTRDEIREQFRTYMRDTGSRARKPAAWDDPRHVLFDNWENRYNVEGVDVQSAYDRRIDAQFAQEDSEYNLEIEVRRTKLPLQRARRDAFYEVLREIRPVGGNLDLVGPPVRGETEGEAALPPVESAIPIARAAEWLPRDWIDSSNRHKNKLETGGLDERGRYTHEMGYRRVGDGYFFSTITLSEREGEVQEGVAPRESVAVHELVHRAEHTHDGITGAEWTFYVSRVSPGINRKWEDTRKLAEVTGGGYKDHEVTRTDDFIDAYSGKDYGSDMDSSYEILTMGIQDLVTGEHGIMEGDEEYRQFVYGALALL